MFSEHDLLHVKATLHNSKARPSSSKGKGTYFLSFGMWVFAFSDSTSKSHSKSLDLKQNSYKDLDIWSSTERVVWSHAPPILMPYCVPACGDGTSMRCLESGERLVVWGLKPLGERIVFTSHQQGWARAGKHAPLLGTFPFSLCPSLRV